MLYLRLIMIYLSISKVIESFKIKFSNRSEIEKYSQHSTSKNEENLIKILFSDYNPNVIPRPRLNESLKIYMGLSMSQLLNIVNFNLI